MFHIYESIFSEVIWFNRISIWKNVIRLTNHNTMDRLIYRALIQIGRR